MTEFEVDGKKYAMRKPSLRATNEAEMIYSKAMGEALAKPGIILRLQMDDWLKQKGIWDQDKEKEIQDLKLKLVECLDKLRKGGIKLSEAKQLAFDARSYRLAIISVSAYKNNYSHMTAEDQAEGAKFSYLLSECLMDMATNKKVFASYEAFLDSDNKALYNKATEILSDMMYGNTEEYLNNLPENKFLNKYDLFDKEIPEEPVVEPVYLDDEGNPIKEEVKAEVVTQ